MTIEQKALELVRAHGGCYGPALEAAIEAHEADKSRHAAELREQAERFSEAAKEAVRLFLIGRDRPATEVLSPFILVPVDPLVEVLNEVMPEVTGEGYGVVDADALRAALEARGLAIVKKEAVNG